MQQYQQGLEDCYDVNERLSGRGKAGKAAKVWDYIPNKKAFVGLSTEAFSYVLGSCVEEVHYSKVALKLGSRLEYQLWKNHPLWGNSWHLKGIKLAMCDDTDMACVMRSVGNKQFKLAGDYKPMTKAERVILGSYFILTIAETTGLIIKASRRLNNTRIMSVLQPSPLLSEFLSNWKESWLSYRPMYVPMIAPPRPYTDLADGGYYSIRTSCFKIYTEKYAETMGRADEKPHNTINYLQSIPFRLDNEQIEIAKHLWEQNISIGKLPRRTKAEKPRDYHYGTNREFWQAYFAYKVDKRQDGERTRFLNALITADRLKDAEKIYYVWFLDHRGRAYSRSGQINYLSSSFYRSMLRFDQTAPIKGYEDDFAYAVGDALGLPANRETRISYFNDVRESIERVGENPIDNMPYWEGLKDPWKFLQLARDWAEYRKDETFRTGIVFQLDQTCSGFGHLACLTRDARLAEMVCVTGTERGDIYQAVSNLCLNNVKDKLEIAYRDGDDKTVKMAECWLGHWPDRKLFKTVTMPVVYGRAHSTVMINVGQYLRDEIRHFLIGDLRIVELGTWLSSIISKETTKLLPNVGALGQWLKLLANTQLECGASPHWWTPDGYRVNCDSYIKATCEGIVTTAAGPTRMHLPEPEKNTLTRKVKAPKMVADYVHSMDAAFLRFFVDRWSRYEKPIVTVHDCFGTTLDNVGYLHQELSRAWRDFYQYDHLSGHMTDVLMEAGRKLPAPPIVGDLMLSQIGKNPHLFG